MRISIEEAAERLLAGDLVAIPTETVYGLAARFDRPEAIQKIFALKNRPPENPLILHLASSQEIAPFVAELPAQFQLLSQNFWPGPLTLVMPIIPSTLPSIVRADLPTQAFRVPSHPVTLKLLTRTGPLVAPSANLSGRPSASAPHHVEHDFGRDFPILDGGPAERGIESTILIWNLTNWQLGRLGAIPPEAFEPILGYLPEQTSQSKPLCPGQLFRHYQPQARLQLGGDLTMASVLVGFSDRPYPHGPRLISWGPSTNPAAVLQQFYATLRQLDLEQIPAASIDVDVPSTGLWRTFLERLEKAKGN